MIGRVGYHIPQTELNSVTPVTMRYGTQDTSCFLSMENQIFNLRLQAVGDAYAAQPCRRLRLSICASFQVSETKQVCKFLANLCIPCNVQSNAFML